MASIKPPIREAGSRSSTQNLTPAERAMQEVYNANILSRIEEVARVGSFRWKPTVGRLALSAEFYRMLSRTTAQFDGTLERFLGFFHPEDHDELLDTLRRALRKEQSFRQLARIVRPNKETRVLDIAGNVIPDEHGIIVEVYCICRDITEEQLMETRLLQSEARFSLLVGRMKEYAIYMLDTSGRITTWNESAQRIKGYNAEEIIGEHISRFYTPDDVKHGKPEKLLRQAKQTGRAEEEGWRVRKDGSLFWADVVITGLWDDKGNVRGFGKLTRDLTAQRLAERALNENQERLRAIFEHSPSMIFMKDGGGRYIDCNPPFEELCGKPRNEIIGKTDLELFDHRQATEFINNDRLVFEQGKPVKFEETAQHKDGPRVSIVTKFPLRDSSGNIFAIGGIVTDITQRKRTEESTRQVTGRLIQLQDEEELRVAEQLESGPVRILDTLASRLNALAESSTGLDQRASEALRKSLELAREARHALDAVTQTTYLRMLEEKGLLETLRSYQQNFSQETGMKVVLDLPGKLKRLPTEAERALFRVVQESLTNTHRHSESNAATVQLTQIGNNITLSITDSGKGISAGVLEAETGSVISSGVGIRGMMERMRLLEGSLEIHTGDWGTTVNAILPLNTRQLQK